MILTALVARGHAGTCWGSEVLCAEALFMSKGFIKSPLSAARLSFFQILPFFRYPVFKVT